MDPPLADSLQKSTYAMQRNLRSRKARRAITLNEKAEVRRVRHANQTHLLGDAISWRNARLPEVVVCLVDAAVAVGVGAQVGCRAVRCFARSCSRRRRRCRRD